MLDVRIEFAFEDHLGDFFARRKCGRINNNGRCWDGDHDLGLVNERRSDVASVFILSADIFGDTLECVEKGVGLFVVTAVEDVSLEVGAIALKLGWWLSLRTVSTTTTVTATLIPSA